MSEIIKDHKMVVGKLGSGYAAVLMSLVEDNELGEYWDIEQTGIGRYDNKADAIKEAISWANEEGIRLEL